MGNYFLGTTSWEITASRPRARERFGRIIRELRPQRDSNLSGPLRRQLWHDADLHRLSRRFGEVRTYRLIPREAFAFRRGDGSARESWQPRGNRIRALVTFRAIP